MALRSRLVAKWREQETCDKNVKEPDATACPKEEHFTPLANGDIKIDPIYGLNVDGVASAGSYTAACTKISTTSVAGQCRSCGGSSKIFAKTSLNPNIYLCQ